MSAFAAHDERPFRIEALPPYALGSVAEAVREARSAGRDIIDLSQINPADGAPAIAVDKLVQAALQPHNHRYSASAGIERLRESFASFYERRFGVSLNVADEVVATLGTKEGLSHLLQAVCHQGDTVLVPTPSYPIHNAGVFLAGAAFLGVPLFSSWEQAERDDWQLSGNSEEFFYRVQSLLQRSWPRPRVMILSFPHNPTTATATLDFYERIVSVAREYGSYILHDFAYADICFDDYHAPSILQVPGARKCAVEFYSLSKGLGMAGWRIGACVGNPALVGALKKIKSYLDFGIFQPMQLAAADVLAEAEAQSAGISENYESRRDALVAGLRHIGWHVPDPKGSVFVWGQIPRPWRQMGSVKFSHQLLEQAGVAVSPGAGFGSAGEDCVRFALVATEQRIRTAVRNIEVMMQGGSGDS